jgi:hypothetical protein
MLPGVDIAVYEVIVDPPLLAGAVYATVAVNGLVAVAVPIVGVPGTVVGVAELDAALFAEFPTALVA